jgi:alkylation response protein AidB-like acyl-CoA dehydrogenase
VGRGRLGPGDRNDPAGILAAFLAVCQISAMDLRERPELTAFREEVRSFLDRHVPGRAPGTTPLASLDTAEGFEAHRHWEQTLFEARLSVVSWPERYGGRGLGLEEWLVFEDEYYRAQAPLRVSQNGIFLLAPTLFAFGTEEQRERFLLPMASGEQIWCQGWSEPDSGSDLASLRSRAERRRGRWVLNGQKTWCSRGAFADWCFGLFRTDPGAERHRGLTYFLVPLEAPGVHRRPIPQLDGDAGFAELFFDDVEVPDDQVLGEPGRGWRVAMATTSSERGLTLRSPSRFTEAAGRLVDLWQETRAADPDLAARSADQVASAWIDAEAYRLATEWTAARLVAGGELGAESSIMKLQWSEADLAIADAAMALLGEQAELLGADHRPSPWTDRFLFALAGPIYAGTNEIQRTVVAERVLGLPR